MNITNKMIFSNKLYLCLALVLLIIFIVPFLYVNKFVFLAADDFCRTGSSFSSYFQNISLWYNNHNGRYANAAFSLLPVYKVEVYRIVLTISFLFLPVASWFFIKEMFCFFNFKIANNIVLFITVLFCILLIGQLPSVYQFLYWYAGVSAYMYSVLLLLIFLAQAFKLYREKLENPFFIFLVLILIVGNNEILILLVNFILMTILFSFFFQKKKFNRLVIVLNALSLICSLLVIFAPGSIKRQELQPGGGDISESIIDAFLSTSAFTLKSFFEIPYMIFYVGFILFICYLFNFSKLNNQKFLINPIILASISFMAVFTVIFVPYYATGYVKINEGRIGNMIHIIYLIVLFINLFNFSLFLIAKFAVFQSIKVYLPLGLFTLSLLLILTHNKNYTGIIRDFKQENFQNFKNQIESRNKFLMNYPYERIELEPIKSTETIPYFDIKPNKNHWSNECYLNSFNSKYKKNYKSITVGKGVN